MAFIKVQAETYHQCRDKIREQYGESAEVVKLEQVTRGGWFFGLGARDMVQATVKFPSSYIPTPPGYGASFTGDAGTVRAPVRVGSVDEEKAKILALGAAMTGKGANTVPPAAQIKNDEALTEVLDELKKLREKVDEGFGAATDAVPAAQAHPSLARIEKELETNDFSPAYRKYILDRARKEFPLAELDDYERLRSEISLWIGESVKPYEEPPATETATGKKQPKIIVLVGTTGAGKTTTIAKFAFLYGEPEDGYLTKQVRLITLDYYRIGGMEQIEKYGEYLGAPVSLANDYDDLKKLLSHYREGVDYILIDTIGRSPNDYGELAKMKKVLSACPSRAEVRLCISASVTASNFKETMKQFETFGYSSVIVTKLDETIHAGNVVSALWEAGKPVSFVTTSQTVPGNIERFVPGRFLKNIEGFD